ncbi:iron complex outermembrane recepter protein [Flavobacterium succinicans]|uniref:Iron complex outermembrane recepter protein n=1 Tax=Flavobacterium succinicans TaxID=29536 RepID=A0A1I4RQH7_9FLAO|nr:TonB-dependent receptor [Flavobacterium succinicans]SFM54454.1 iron complex outermembrane recepter protein [Flavobacterium succinicans]
MNTIITSKRQKPKGKSQNHSSRIFFLLFTFHFSLFTFAQVQDTTKVNQLDDVLVSAVRVTSKTPVSFSNLTKKQIQFRNLGQDIPTLMNYMPSVVTTSDAGNGIGYSGIRVRGSDATRVNVTINGIPYNDSESHGTFWVNMPDFVSSVESIQLQRGVGTSTNGSGAFGASLNMLTDSYTKEASAEIASSAGSFNTFKNTVKFSTGLLNDHFEIAGRLSVLQSDGYIDRASTDLKSYFLQGTYVGKTTLLKALVFGGKEKTYQAWNGIDGETLNNDRTFNSAGIYTDEAGNTRFYDNETDNYQQDHSQLHWNERWSDNWSSNFALHYTKGKGYYENYKEDAKFSSYGLNPIVINGTTINKTDLVRQKWLDNDFYGATFSTNYTTDALQLILGGGYNKYEGLHFGKVIWARYASQSELGDRYYEDFATKTDGNFFAKANYQVTEQLSLFGDLQYRHVQYKADSPETGLVNDTFRFFNPKAGLNFKVNEANTLYFSYARANREPNRTDYENGNPKSEKLNDFELGWRLNTEKIQLNTNIYYMAYKDQLILTGKLDDVGNPIRSNSDKSYRLGLEVDATIALSEQWMMRPNFTLSANKNVDLNITGTNFGTTDIAYSPSVIVGNVLVFSPIKALHLSLLQKFVGEQFMNNIELPAAKLADYFVNDFNVSYTFKPKTIFKEIVLSGLVNNFLDKKYVSNGYMYDIYPSYYPQAGINFLAGLNLKF